MIIVLTGRTDFVGKTPLWHWAAWAGQGIAPEKVSVFSRNPGKLLKQLRDIRQQPWPRFHEGGTLLPDTPTFIPQLHFAFTTP
jgi:hypothetical protein